jgi:hypothetical protein
VPAVCPWTAGEATSEKAKAKTRNKAIAIEVLLFDCISFFSFHLVLF